MLTVWQCAPVGKPEESPEGPNSIEDFPPFTGPADFTQRIGPRARSGVLAAEGAAFSPRSGTLSDRFGRKPVLVAGWLVALPIPPLLIWAPNWGWVVAANVLLGVNQGLTWSTTVIMKIDLAGPARRGLAMGLNEAAGYGAVAITALATRYLAAAYGLRPAAFLVGAACIALGLGLSAAFVRETRGHARHEAAAHVAAAGHLGGHLTTRQVAWLTSFSEPALSAACQAGMVNNLNDGVAWGVFPVLFARHGLAVSQIGILARLSGVPGSSPPAHCRTASAANG